MKNDNVFLPGRQADRRRRVARFCYPHQVVNDPHLDIEEKRAILSAWASDENAVESMPTLRHLPGTPIAVTFSSIMDARIQLDRLSSVANDDDPPPLPGNRKRQANGWEAAA